MFDKRCFKHEKKQRIVEENKFSSIVLAWYAQNKRDLPWRKTTDPYKILVSEFMLQQTQVSRVMPIYEKFLAKFPDFETLARSELADVLIAWKGLGYNRRAKLLWLLAKNSQKILYRNESKSPYGNLTEIDQKTLETLPGIGHYTAAALLAFSANRDIIAIDTNIRRIHSRVFGRTDEPFLQNLVPEGKGRDWNNALMDFANIVCTKTPKCETCPLQTMCQAYKTKDFTVVVPKQSTFKESNRFYRGRIMDVLREGEKTKQELLHIGPKEKVLKALTSLEKDALIVKEKNMYRI